MVSLYKPIAAQVCCRPHFKDMAMRTLVPLCSQATTENSSSLVPEVANLLLIRPGLAQVSLCFVETVLLWSLHVADKKENPKP